MNAKSWGYNFRHGLSPILSQITQAIPTELKNIAGAVKGVTVDLGTGIDKLSKVIKKPSVSTSTLKPSGVNPIPVPQIKTSSVGLGYNRTKLPKSSISTTVPSPGSHNFTPYSGIGTALSPFGLELSTALGTEIMNIAGIIKHGIWGSTKDVITEILKHIADNTKKTATATQSIKTDTKKSVISTRNIATKKLGIKSPTTASISTPTIAAATTLPKFDKIETLAGLLGIMGTLAAFDIHTANRNKNLWGSAEAAIDSMKDEVGSGTVNENLKLGNLLKRAFLFADESGRPGSAIVKGQEDFLRKHPGESIENLSEIIAMSKDGIWSSLWNNISTGGAGKPGTGMERIAPGHAPITMPPTPGLPERLGEVSQTWEVGRNKTPIQALQTISSGVGDAGGISYGPWQLSSLKGSVARYLDMQGKPWKNELLAAGPVNSSQFQDKWREIAARDTDAFYASQKQFIADTHYGIANAYAATNTRFNTEDLGVANAIWSTAVQHGPGRSGRTHGAMNILDAANRTLGANPTPQEQIDAIYNARANAFSRDTKRYTEEREAAKSLAGQKLSVEKPISPIGEMLKYSEMVKSGSLGDILKDSQVIEQNRQAVSQSYLKNITDSIYGLQDVMKKSGIGGGVVIPPAPPPQTQKPSSDFGPTAHLDTLAQMAVGILDLMGN
jgi:hypothetical protein